jgi:hypothetical protein
MGELLGATFAMVLFGALLAWVIRKATKIPAIPSYVAGVGIMTVVGGWLYSLDGRYTFLQAWTVYLIGGVIAAAVLIVVEMRRSKAQPGGRMPM